MYTKVKGVATAIFWLVFIGSVGAISFSGVMWNGGLTGGSSPVTLDKAASDRTGTVVVDFNPDLNQKYSGTYTITSTGIIGNGGTDTIGGFTNNLGSMHLENGNFVLSVMTTATTVAPGGNMFSSQPFSPGRVPQDGSFTPQSFTGNPTVTITFTFNGAQFQSVSSSPVSLNFN